MEITDILRKLTNDDAIAEIAQKAAASKADVSNVLSKLTELVNDKKNGLKLDSATITELTGKLLAGKSVQELLTQLLGEDGEGKLAKLTGLKGDSLQSILGAASEKLGELTSGKALLENGLKSLSEGGLKNLGGLFR